MSEICEKCGLPKEVCTCEERAREGQKVSVSTETRTYGKKVTIVSGITDPEINVKDLASELKSKCACGGTYKDKKIELQGDQVRKAKKCLEDKGFQVET